MIKTLQRNWKIYLIEAWALGMFMLATCAFTIIMEHPSVGMTNVIESAFGRRIVTGIAMGVTAILLIYSSWGKRSGAHMNPAFTLANLQMNRISSVDAFFYIAAQFIGGVSGVVLLKLLVFDYIADPSVAYAITVPLEGPLGIWLALSLEFLLSFTLLATVLLLSNYEKLSPYTGYFVGFLLFLFITFEAPYSGMSINPARTVASSLPAGNWNAIWVYFAGPILGMVSAGFLYRKYYRVKNGECLSMNCFMSGSNQNNKTYEVLKYVVDGQKITANKKAEYNIILSNKVNVK